MANRLCFPAIQAEIPITIGRAIAKTADKADNQPLTDEIKWVKAL